MGFIFITFVVVAFWHLLKLSFKKAIYSTFYGLKGARLKFKTFDSFDSHALFVIRKREYEVVYRLETEEGEISINMDGQLKVSTHSKQEGRKILSFTRFKPSVNFRGIKAKNGECSIKIYRKR